MTIRPREKLTIPARDVAAGDLIELEKTSGGITLTAQRTLVLDVRQYDATEDAPENTWLRLDPTGVPPMGGRHNSILGTFLRTDEEVEVWRSPS